VILILTQEDHKWNWSAAHSWQSWRNRYVTNREDFDFKINKYIRRHNIPVPSTPKRPGQRDPSGRPAKRQRRAAHFEELNTQEKQLVKLAWPSPVYSDRPRHGSIQLHDQPTVKKEPAADTVKVNGLHLTQGPSSIHDSANGKHVDDQDEDYEPPGSEDYDGEIFENEDAKVNEPGEGNQSPRTENDDVVDGALQTADSNAMHPGSQHTIKKHLFKGSAQAM
jgi:hypothetical protein